ncbi:hypothetical protein HY36_12190 [Hyphomonas atlantica]|uniref:Uncharacterized protein n=1 Tax=Hyphomonas atlantica TaxID=1280948 RepID=A0A059EAB6_9PROT|nr:hypothetical protein HY36_12190 [Hyphomonas atlantica]
MKMGSELAMGASRKSLATEATNNQRAIRQTRSDVLTAQVD